MDIIQYVADKVGISREQAEVGVALILKFAKSKLGDKFDTVAGFIPGANEIMAKAPAGGSGGGGGIGGMLGGLASSLTGGGGGGAEGLAELAGGFAESGISADKIPETANAVGDYVSEQGGGDAKSLLTSLLN